MLKIVVDRPIFASAGIERPNRRQYYNTMSNSINPYESPQANVPFGPKADAQPNFPACSIGLMAASVLVGALVTASAIYFIYVDDPRTGTRSAPTLEFAVSAGAALSSVIWLVFRLLSAEGNFRPDRDLHRCCSFCGRLDSNVRYYVCRRAGRCLLRRVADWRLSSVDCLLSLCVSEIFYRYATS